MFFVLIAPYFTALLSVIFTCWYLQSVRRPSQKPAAAELCACLGTKLVWVLVQMMMIRLYVLVCSRCSGFDTAGRAGQVRVKNVVMTLLHRIVHWHGSKDHG